MTEILLAVALAALILLDPSGLVAVAVAGGALFRAVTWVKRLW